MLIVLDTGPLGLISNPSANGDARRAHAWARARIEAGDRIVVPEIADYELRRELLRAGKDKGIERLDALATAFGFEPLTTPIMRAAAALWATARNAGLPTAHSAALDGDVILAAQARALATTHGDTVVATTNPKHLERHVDARVWHSI